MTISTNPTKPMRAALKAVWREFRRCADRYAPLYHELFQPCDSDEQHQDDGLSVCAAFREANKDRFAAPWEEWHATEDGQLFGRFTGAAEGLDEFRRLAESGYLVVLELGLGWPDYGYQGWLMLIHEMANSYATPLLRSELSHWGLEHLADTDYDDQVFDLTEKWAVPTDGSVSYPLHPFHWTLHGNVFTASMAAVELILDADKALLVGDYIGDFPLAIVDQSEDRSGSHVYGEHGRTSEIEIDAAEVCSSAGTKGAPDIAASHGPLRRFAFSQKWNRWEIRFDEDNPNDTIVPDLQGLHYIAILLRHPDSEMWYWELNVEAGFGVPPSAQQIAILEAACSKQEIIGKSEMRELRRHIQSVGEELACTLNPERRAELEHLRMQLDARLRTVTVCRRRPRLMGGGPTKEARQIRSHISKARKAIAQHGMPQCAAFLKRCVARGLQFVFVAPESGLEDESQSEQF